jgi:AmiR/NasT family two-component response regulator
VQRAILVVDPEVDHRTWLRALLASNGSLVVGEATDPEDAMRQAAMKRPDVAVVAAELAPGDGIHLASRLGTQHGIPTVLVAAPVAPPDIARAAQAGVMGFLVKPVDPSTLRGMLEIAVCRFQEILSLRREAEALRRSLEFRKVIERAKGLLMEMEQIPEQEAFARLRQKSMDTQRPMAEIARAVILAAEVSGRAR